MRRDKRRKSLKRGICLLTADVLAAAAIAGGIYGYDYMIPHGAVQAAPLAVTQKILEDTAEASGIEEKAAAWAQSIPLTQGTWQRTAVKTDPVDWHEKFADQFTKEVVSTEDSYTSPNLAIHLTRDSFETKQADSSENGRHLGYGTRVSYVLADIYVGDITCLQTAFAQDTYGNGYSELLTDMSKRIGSVLAVNGDSYSNDRHRDNGTIIRNGIIYRAQKTDMETCVLNWDGTMQIYAPDELDTQTLIDNGAYQSWIFGPSLLDENGKAKTSFQTWDYIRESHPRTAIGYYEPGHYCLLVVDGRQAGYSRGMFLEEMAALFENLGCKAAYNLDGGHCSFMTMGTVQPIILTSRKRRFQMVSLLRRDCK